MTHLREAAQQRLAAHPAVKCAPFEDWCDYCNQTWPCPDYEFAQFVIDTLDQAKRAGGIRGASTYHSYALVPDPVAAATPEEPVMQTSAGPIVQRPGESLFDAYQRTHREACGCEHCRKAIHETALEAMHSVAEGSKDADQRPTPPEEQGLAGGEQLPP